MEKENKYNFIPLSEPIPITDQVWPEGTTPLVHTRTMTFMHEKFIRECIEGILMQKTTFPVQVLIHDDASTDKTAEIVKEYELKYPRLIKTFFQEENSSSKPDKHKRREEFMSWRMGKYEALCEGDDYWTDPLKLQKQVDFLEVNSDCKLCVGGYKLYNVNSKESKEVITVPKGVAETSKGYYFKLGDMNKKYFTKTLTALFPYDELLNGSMQKYKYSRDVHLFYHLMKNNKYGYYFKEIFGVYRVHSGGIHSSIQEGIKWSNQYLLSKELFEINKDDYSRIMHLRHITGLLIYSALHFEKSFFEIFRLFLEMCKNLRSIVELRIIYGVFKDQIRTRIKENRS